MTERTVIRMIPVMRAEDRERNRKAKRRKRRILLRIILGVLLLAVLFLSLYEWRFGFGLFRRKTVNGLVPVKLVAVYDGDTILVRMPDGSEETVRLLMIDAPESKHPDETKNTEEGRRAAEFLKKRLPKGTSLYLEYEQGENHRDSYGRLLAFVWLTSSTSVESTYIKENMLNAIILSEGHAVFHLYDNGNPVREEYRKVLEDIR